MRSVVFKFSLFFAPVLMVVLMMAAFALPASAGVLVTGDAVIMVDDKSPIACDKAHEGALLVRSNQAPVICDNSAWVKVQPAAQKEMQKETQKEVAK